MKEIKISDIHNFKIGHSQDKIGGTGCTVIICEKGAVAGVDVRGGAPASRETDLLKPINTVEHINAVLLSGGSAFGLDAASGIMSFLEERKIGFNFGFAIIPIVCGASLFDLNVSDPKARPDKAMGYAACLNAFNSNDIAEGNVGAGTGATVGKLLGSEYMMKSGIGSYAVEIDGLQCGAIVAVNALGDVLDINTKKPLAGVLSSDKTYIGDTVQLMYKNIKTPNNMFSGNTTIGCILTNAKLTKTQANKISQNAHDGYAQVIRPVHTSVDGDSIFCMSCGNEIVSVDALGTLAAEVIARAINNAVLKASSAFGLKSANVMTK
jgi:L-aminopeptidase/D-esterase-like protein